MFLSPGEIPLVFSIFYKIAPAIPIPVWLPWPFPSPTSSLQFLSEKWDLRFDKFTGLLGHMG